LHVNLLNVSTTSGPFLVSRTGNAGCTERDAKEPKFGLMRFHKSCVNIQTARRWPWKSEPSKECVTTHLPNVDALKKDGAEARLLCVSVVVVGCEREKEATTCRGAWGPRDEARARAGVERPLVQILVGVAIIQVRVLKTEEEKGSVRSAMRHR